jgi:hypothetical protein
VFFDFKPEQVDRVDETPPNFTHANGLTELVA